MAKKQGLIGLYSGRKINELAKKKENVTRTQTALNAQKQIIKKYGKVVESAKYLHKGKGEWVKYSLSNDRKRTGKLTTDIKEWRRQPNKLDFKGIDTKGSKGKSEIATGKRVVKKKDIKIKASDAYKYKYNDWMKLWDEKTLTGKI